MTSKLNNILENIKEQHLIRVIVILAGAIFFLPLLTAPGYYYPFITLRNFYFRVLVELMVFFYGTLVLKNPEYLRQKNNIWKILFALLASLTFSSLINGDFLYSFWSNFERMDGLIAFSHQLTFFFILSSVVQTRRVWETLLQTNIFVSLLVILVGLSQTFEMNFFLASASGERITSTIGNPTFLSAYLLLHLFFALYFLIKNREASDMAVYKYGFLVLDILILFMTLFVQARVGIAGKEILRQIFTNAGFGILFTFFHILAYSQFFKIFREKLFSLVHAVFYMTIILFSLYLISKTETRGTVAGLALGIFFGLMLILVKKSFPKKIKIAALGLILVGIFSISSIFIFSESSFIKKNKLLSRISGISLQEDISTRTRVLTWGAAFRGFLEKPIFGWGAENFYRPFDRHFPPAIYRSLHAVVWFDRPHNILLQYLSEGGILALGFYLWFLGAVLFSILKIPDKKISLLFSVFLAAYVGQNLFVFDSINSSFLFFGFLGFLLLPSEPKENALPSLLSQNVIRNSAIKKYSAQIIFVWLIAVLAVIWHANMVPLLTNKNFIGQYLLFSSNAKKIESAQAILRILDESPYLGRAEITSLFLEKFGNFVKSKDLPDIETKQILPRAEEHLVRVLNLRPNEVRLKIFAMNFYKNISRFGVAEYMDKILALREDALALSPTRAQIYNVTGTAYMTKKMYNLGVVDLENAVKLAPRVYEIHYNLFIAYLNNKNLADARKEVLEMVKLRQGDAENFKKIVNLYLDFGYASEAKALALGGIKLFPKDGGLILLLAESQKRLGEAASAKEAAQKAVELDLSLKDRAEALLQELKKPASPKKQ